MIALIIGKNGQLAHELLDTKPEDITAIALGRDDIDITSLDSINAAIEKLKPSVVINSAAYTAVDLAESEPEEAFKINAEGPKNLAAACKTHNLKLVHVSTDFVFNGRKSTPYHTSDATDPINVYGASKLAGEEAIKKIYPENSSIIRTSWLYSVYGNNFVKTMLRLMAERDSLNVVADQIGSPTWARGLAKLIWALSQRKSEPLYHWSDLGTASWFDFAREINEQAIKLGLLTNTTQISPIPAADYPTPAQRPAFSLMETFVEDGLSMQWQDNLREMLTQLQQQ